MITQKSAFVNGFCKTFLRFAEIPLNRLFSQNIRMNFSKNADSNSVPKVVFAYENAVPFGRHFRRVFFVRPQAYPNNRQKFRTIRSALFRHFLLLDFVVDDVARSQFAVDIFYGNAHLDHQHHGVIREVGDFVDGFLFVFSVAVLRWFKALS